MPRRGEIVGKLATLDRMVENIGSDPIEQALVAGPNVADFDVHRLSIAH